MKKEDLRHLEADLRHLEGKDISEVINFADKLFKKSLEGKKKAHYIYNICLEQLPNVYSHQYTKPRGYLRDKIWEAERYFNWNKDFFSQAGQDKCVKNHFFKNLKKGFFVEIGAFNGINGSNCFYFEKFMDWNGIAVEPSPVHFEKLKKNRKCICINKAISNQNDHKEFVEVTNGYTQMSGILTDEYKKTLDIIMKDPRTKMNKLNIKTSTFNEIVGENKIIDYLSIDVEGEEERILESIDFNYFNIKVISVENNYPKKNNYNNLLKDKGFTYFDNYGVDELYYNKKYFEY